MDAAPETRLLDATLARLAAHWAGRNIPRSLQRPDYDRSFGERICRLVEEVNRRLGIAYEAAVEEFLIACTEFLRLQHQLERTGKYPCQSFEQARRSVYDDPRVMLTTYLNSLLLSQALWINHYRLFDFYRRRFCAADRMPEAGRVLEVPVGTGLFLSEFVCRNPSWEALGIDLSASSIQFARQVVSLHGAGEKVTLRQQDVFEAPADVRFDRIICGELLEHVDRPEALLRKLGTLLAPGGRLFLTTAIWAAEPDHVYLFESAAQVRELLGRHFSLEEELVLPLEAGAPPEESRIPINYACVLSGRPAP